LSDTARRPQEVSRRFCPQPGPDTQHGGEPMTYRTPSFVHLLRRARRLLGAALAAALTLLLVPLGQPAAHAITAVSAGTAPFGPANTVIPNWYADAAGVRLQPCAEIGRAHV